MEREGERELSGDKVGLEELDLSLSCVRLSMML